MANIEIKNLSFSYPTSNNRFALDNVSLSITQGQYVTLCGKSGSGKSTLLNQLKTVLTPNGKKEGGVYLDGVLLDDVDLKTQSSTIGYVMQDPDSQIVTDKVWHELAFGLENLGVDQRTIRTRVAEMASYFGIQNWFHKDVTELSGGQKQLLNLASIMAMQPSILILDEPTSQLDPIAASDFLNTVRKINLELGTTVIITEHRLEDIFHASDLVVVMEKGKVLIADEPRRVGAYLKEANSDMFAAMPAPVQIYYGVNGNRVTEKMLQGDALSDKAKQSLGFVPLTVREGRTWLSDIFEEQEIKVNMLPENVYQEKDDDDVAISVKDVWFRYDRDLPDVLKGTNFNVERGKIFAIVGGNGTGKSTTLKTICNILKPYKGTIKINGKKLSAYKNGELFKNNLAMLPQDPKSLFVKQTVREDLEEMLGRDVAKKIEADEEKLGFENVPLDERVLRVARLCDVEYLLMSHPYDLSGGEQQRAALAKVLLTDPKILLLDEPTKGIDNFFKLQFAKILKDLRDSGVTILMVSHDVEFCARYADAVGMFFDGDMITANTPSKFFAENSFYTTAANRMSRHIFKDAITTDDVTQLCLANFKMIKR